MAGFLNRWAQKKAGLEAEAKDIKKESKPPLSSSSLDIVNQPSAAVGTEVKPADPAQTTVSAEEVVPAAPTLEDVLKLTKDSDYSAFVKPGIDPAVQQAAMQKLFSDPHYNIMDGLDIYIDDYSKPDPIPLDMLKKLNQSKMLGLFKTAEEKLADQQAEQIEREDYERRLKALEDQKTELANSDENELPPDETPSDINAQNSAKSAGLESNENLPNVLETQPIKSARKADE